MEIQKWRKSSFTATKKLVGEAAAKVVACGQQIALPLPGAPHSSTTDAFKTAFIKLDQTGDVEVFCLFDDTDSLRPLLFDANTLIRTSNFIKFRAVGTVSSLLLKISSTSKL